MNYILSIGIIALLAAPAFAGSLTPPGAPAPTMKTLDDVEARTPIHAADIPLTISQPGSYYLAENIEQTSTGGGINVNAPGVTIDLNGFTLKGPGLAVGTSSGIRATGSATTGTVVRNGTVTNWPGEGIDLVNSHGPLVEKVVARENGRNGISTQNGTVINCSAEFNGFSGIRVFEFSFPSVSIVSGCSFSNNKQNGIKMDARQGLITNNICVSNSQHGILLDSAKNCTVTNNNSSANGFSGINLSFGSTACVVSENNCSDNSNSGILISSTSSDSRVESNNVSRNDGIGINVSGSSIVIKNTSAGNASNYDISGALEGPIVPLGTGPIASEHPFANFSY